MPHMPTTILSQSFCAQKIPVLHTCYSVKILPTVILFGLFALSGQVQADSISALIQQKSGQPQLAVPAARINTRSSIQRVQSVSPVQVKSSHTALRAKTSQYPEVKRQAPGVLPAFLAGSYDNIDSSHLPLLSRAETHSGSAARDVISMARTMSLNERTIIKGGCWDYLNAVFNRAGVNRSTVHKGVYAGGPYANSTDIKVGDWLYYINHGYNDIEHSGLFVGWVDEAAKQALILSYAGESRQEPARYRVYDLSHVYHIIRPT